MAVQQSPIVVLLEVGPLQWIIDVGVDTLWPANPVGTLAGYEQGQQVLSPSLVLKVVGTCQCSTNRAGKIVSFERFSVQEPR